MPGPGTALGQYQLIRELGRGGMGAVYLARDTRLSRRVAVKFLGHEDPAVAERFLVEARVTARCKHDNIVDIYDVGEVPGYSFMVLEYLEGVTLRGWLKDRFAPAAIHPVSEDPAPMQDDAFGHARRAATQTVPPVEPGAASPALTTGRVSATLAVELMVPVVRALAHAHALGLVHRDLKPENIMLADDGSIKVLDFGIAKVLDAHVAQLHPTGIAKAFDSIAPPSGSSEAPPAKLQDSGFWTEREYATRAGTLVGTMPYMAPEQWRAGDIDGRTDIWALGIILWELCTGRHPLAPLLPWRLRSIGNLDEPMPSLADERPDLGPLTNIVDRCLRKRTSERISSARELLDVMEPLLPGRGRRASIDEGSDGGEPDNPYVGLAAFQRADATRFFGRERDVASMMAQLRNHRMVTVAGPSGAGKSSLVRAGVIPALDRSGQRWEPFIIRPGRRPLAALAELLAQITRASSGTPEAAAEEAAVDLLQARLDTLRDQPGCLGTALRKRCHRHNTRILLFVDQFEELYTLGTERDTREAFVQCLEGVADDASSPLRVVLSVRSDFLDRVAEDRAFTSEITRGMILLSPLSRDQLRAALLEPLAAAGYAMDSQTLIDAMLDTLEATRVPLPLLQFTAARLWDARDRQRKQISQASYDAMGGIEGALATHADAVLAGLACEQQRLVRAVFTSLVSDERTRAIVSMDELRASVRADQGDDLERVVSHLAEARLVLMETESGAGATVELTHESLIECWPTLVTWLDEDEDTAHFRSRLRAAAQQWDKQGRSEDLLWRGQAADEARSRYDRADALLVDLGARDRDYLRAVVALAARSRRRRRQLAAAAFATLGVFALVVTLLAVRAERKAVEARKSAVEADQRTAEARNASRIASARENQSDPTLVLALVREMEPAGQLPPRWSELARWAIYQHLAWAVLAHPDMVESASFSRDGNRIVTAARDNRVRIWSSDGTGTPLILQGHLDFVVSAEFSPDGTRIVTGSLDKTVRVWNADGTGTPLILQGHEDGVTSAAFSPDGARIVTASRDKTVRVWNADGTGTPLVLRGHENVVASAAFSPDGGRIVTASWDKTVRIWSADGIGAPLILQGHQERVSSAAFSPDGTRIVTASRDKTVRVWNADGTGTPLVLQGHEESVYSAAFSPDGARIVTASYDKSVRVWNADGTGIPLVLHGHQAKVSSAVFSPDGARLLTASFDKTVRVWNADRTGTPLVLHGHQERVYAAAFSPDGTRVVTASGDKTARVWNVDGTGTPLVLRGHEERVYAAAFSPDGTRIVTASADSTARVWSADGTGAPLILRGHVAEVNSAVFSPDGARVVTASEDKTARVWNADGTGTPVVLQGHLGRVNSAAFSPDGARVVTASRDTTARVWSVDGTGTPLVLRGHERMVNSAVFSPDGARIVTASGDTTTRVWNADGTGTPLILTGPDAAAYTGTPGGQGAFSPDGAHLLILSDDNTLRVCNVDGTGQPAILRIPELDAWSASFSPDGTRIATASHAERDPTTGTTKFWATVWPGFKPYTGVDDPELWTATTYCPPIDLRKELLGVSEALAAQQLAACQARVAAARTPRRAGGMMAPGPL